MAEVNTTWTEQMLLNLKYCSNRAKIGHKALCDLGIKEGYQSLLLEEWKYLYPNSSYDGNNLATRLYVLEHPPKKMRKWRRKINRAAVPKETSIAAPQVMQDIQNADKPIESNKTQAERMLNQPDTTEYNSGNINKEEMSRAFTGLRHGSFLNQRQIFSAICYNCGMLLYGSLSEGHIFTFHGTQLMEAPVVVEMKDYVLPLPYSKGQTLFSCNICKKGPRQLYSCRSPDTGEYQIPVPLKILRNSYERGQISLGGLFSSTLKKANAFKRCWTHTVGEVNILSKLPRHYHGMYGFIVRKPENIEDNPSEGRIRSALNFLRHNNHLYRSFAANYKTMYRYQAHNVAATANELLDAKNKPVEEHLDAENIGLAVPLDNQESLPALNPRSDQAGIQHPKKTETHESKISYLDPDLEAKAWPCLFPFGVGSWYFRSELPMMTYVKRHLLNIDPRWRRDNQWPFFWLDRMFKARLFYNARARKASVTKEAENPVTVGDLLEEEEASVYQQYGTQVPNTIPGSKSYWSSKLLEVLEMSAELGKPTFFITLTQNDGWHELQSLVKNGYEEPVQKSIQELLIEHPNPCIDHSTETVVAFMKRLKDFKQNVLAKKNGPLGHVLNWWMRKEFQNRGALHVHMVVWCDPETVPADAVRAELPRANTDNTSCKAMRESVKKFQVHNCRPERCFSGNNGSANPACKYGFPFKEQGKECLDVSGIRLLYKRSSQEDLNIVPYNLPILLTWFGHMNIQRVTSGGWEVYHAKYVSKADLKLPPTTTEVERFLRTRIVGRLEVDTILLQNDLARASREIV